MCVTTRQKRQNNLSTLPPIYIANEKIQDVNSHNVLGITIDNNLSWSEHIITLCKKVSQKIFQLSKIKHFLNRHARKQFFHAHVQSQIDYASTLWDSASANVLKPLESIYKRALKLILLKSISLTPGDYVSVDVLPLKLRLQFNKAITMQKVMTGSAPPLISKLFQVDTIRQSKRLVVPLPRIDLFKSSLMFSGADCWNNLPSSLKSITSHKGFKTSLKKHLMSKIN